MMCDWSRCRSKPPLEALHDEDDMWNWQSPAISSEECGSDWVWVTEPRDQATGLSSDEMWTWTHRKFEVPAAASDVMWNWSRRAPNLHADGIWDWSA